MNILKKLVTGLYSKTFAYSLPWIFLILGGTSLCVGVFADFNNNLWNQFLKGIGESIISGGIITLLLKSMQFLGIIKEELSKIISDPEYLKNRYDLEKYWDTVTCALFENKFTAINHLITKDIKRTYLPTKDAHYYENSFQIYEIEIIDKDLNTVRVIERRSLIMIPTKQPYSYDYPYKIEIKGDSKTAPTVHLDYFKVNNSDGQVNESPKITNGDNLAFGFTAKIAEGHDTFLIEYQVTRTYPLGESSVISFKMNHIHYNLRVQVLFKDVDVEFQEAGILSKFKTNYETESFFEKEFIGLMYKGQGFTLYLEQKKDLLKQKIGI